MSIINVTEARRNLYKLIAQVNASHTPVIITGKNANGVVIAQSDWEDLQETLYLSSIPNMNDSIKQGMKESTKDCDTELKW